MDMKAKSLLSTLFEMPGNGPPSVLHHTCQWLLQTLQQGRIWSFQMPLQHIFIVLMQRTQICLEILTLTGFVVVDEDAQNGTGLLVFAPSEAEILKEQDRAAHILAEELTKKLVDISKTISARVYEAPPEARFMGMPTMGFQNMGTPNMSMPYSNEPVPGFYLASTFEQMMAPHQVQQYINGPTSMAAGNMRFTNPLSESQAQNTKPNFQQEKPQSTSPTNLEAWKSFVQKTPRCEGAEGVRESSYFWKKSLGSGGALVGSSGYDENSHRCLKHLFRELKSLDVSLPALEHPDCSIWVRFDEETPQYMRVLMAASLSGSYLTPYAGGLFCFDVFVPGNYPQVPPKVHLLNTGGGRVGFGPNLYHDGKVCLSLLGTWHGPGWDPRHSNLHQVLLSIQGLILGTEHPYFLEPGFGGWEGRVKDGAFHQSPANAVGTSGNASGAEVASIPTAAAEIASLTLCKEKRFGPDATTTKNTTTATTEVGIPIQVILYEDELRVGTLKYAIMEPLTFSLDESAEEQVSFWSPFRKIIQGHFYQNRENVVRAVKSWLSDEICGRDRKQAMAFGSSQVKIDTCKALLPKLQACLTTLSMPKDTQKKNRDKNSGVADGSGRVSATFADSDGKSTTEMNAKVDSESERSIAASILQRKHKEMEAAAKVGNFILAGEIQKQVAEQEEELEWLEKLERSMEEAAAKRDYIRAGRLQAQLKALSSKDSSQAETAEKTGQGKTPADYWMASEFGGNPHDEGFDGPALEYGGPPPQFMVGHPAAYGGIGVSEGDFEMLGGPPPPLSAPFGFAPPPGVFAVFGGPPPTVFGFPHSSPGPTPGELYGAMADFSGLDGPPHPAFEQTHMFGSGPPPFPLGIPPSNFAFGEFSAGFTGSEVHYGSNPTETESPYGFPGATAADPSDSHLSGGE